MDWVLLQSALEVYYSEYRVFHRALFTYEGNSNDIRLAEKGGELTLLSGFHALQCHAIIKRCAGISLSAYSRKRWSKYTKRCVPCSRPQCLGREKNPQLHNWPQQPFDAFFLVFFFPPNFICQMEDWRSWWRSWTAEKSCMHFAECRIQTLVCLNMFSLTGFVLRFMIVFQYVHEHVH